MNDNLRDVFAHPNSIVESSKIGPRTRIWAFVHVLAGARIGADCNICDHVFIENDVIVGDRVTVKSGVQLWDGVTLGDDVFVGPNATFTNDPFPRSRRPPSAFARTTVRPHASIGANATILPGVTIGRNAMVGAGAVVMHDVPPNAIVIGNPAYVRGYVNARVGLESRGPSISVEPPEADVQPTRVRGATLYRLPYFEDLRGGLAVGELGRGLPFLPRRIFFVFGVPSREVRGEHCHRTLHQLLICVAGECSVLVDDGTDREQVSLDSPRVALHLEPMVWSTQYRFSGDAVLLVAASAGYDASDYIRNYDEFVDLATKPRPPDPTAELNDTAESPRKH